MRYIATALMFLAFLAPRTSFAQHEEHMTGQPLELKILVDGAKTPDQITDDLAYHHFFLATAESITANEEEKSRQTAKLGQVKLSDIDRAALVSRLAIFKVQIDQLERWRTELVAAVSAQDKSTISPGGLEELKVQEQKLVQATRDDLKNVLSADGVLALEKYVKKDVKSHIVILGN